MAQESIPRYATGRVLQQGAGKVALSHLRKMERTQEERLELDIGRPDQPLVRLRDRGEVDMDRRGAVEEYVPRISVLQGAVLIDQRIGQIDGGAGGIAQHR